MFWFSRDTLKKLCGYPRPFGDAQKKQIIYLMKKEYPDFPDTFKFDKNEYLEIENKEAFFVKAIIETSNKKTTQTMKINQILRESCLCYEENTIFYLKGSHSRVFLITRESKQFVRKEATRENDLKDLRQEAEIMKKLVKIEKPDLFLLPVQIENNFIDMECATNTLDSFLLVKEEFSFNDKVILILKICKLLMELHLAGFLHRDIHPGNFFIFENERDFSIKLGDFGWSIEKGEVTDDGYRHYSNLNEYQAPEARISLSHCSEMSEVYSLGKIINFIMKKKPTVFSHELERISRKCCYNNPESRYHAVYEVERDIKYLAQI